MRFDYDLSTAPVVKPIPDGTYIFRVVSSKDKKSKKNDNDMIMWELEIVEPKVVLTGPDGSQSNVEKYFHWTVVTEGTLGFLRQFFEACERLKPGPWSPEDLYGASFGGQVIKTVNDLGQEQNNITKYFRVSETRPEIRGAA